MYLQTAISISVINRSSRFSKFPCLGPHATMLSPKLHKDTNSSCELFKLHRQEQYENEKISLTLSQLHPFSSKLISYGYVLHHSGFHGLRRLTSGRVSVISTIHKHSEKYQTPTVPLQCPELRHLCVYSNSQPYWVLFPMINKRQAEAQEKFVFQVLSVAQ